MTQDYENFLSEFSIPTTEQWKAEAEKSLKGKPVDKLITKTPEGIDIKPIYQQEDLKELEYLQNHFPGFFPFDRGTKSSGYKINPWEIVQSLDFPCPSEYNKFLKAALDKGQTAISIKPIKMGSDYGTNNYGTAIDLVKDYEDAFNGVDLSKHPLYIETGKEFYAEAAMFFAYLKKNGIKDISGAFTNDFISVLETEGKLNNSIEASYENLSQIFKYTNANFNKFGALTINANIYNDGGASAVQEIAFSLAKAVEYVRNLQEHGLNIDEICSQINFSYSVGPNFFFEIAKLRAAKVLWAKIVKAFGGNEESQKMKIHSKTCTWNKSRLDPYVNLLRNTTETLSAILGNSDSIEVSNFDVNVGLPDEFSQRIARNTQVVLLEECNLTNVIDPAAGSYYIEAITDQLARKAWDSFREIEKEGGMLKALTDGSIQNQIDTIRKDREKNYSTRKDVLLGTNKFPNLNEEKIKKYPVDLKDVMSKREAVLSENQKTRNGQNIEKLISILKSVDTLPQIEKLIEIAEIGACESEIQSVLLNQPVEIKKIELFKPTDIFEGLRNFSDEYKSKHGNFPQIYLANFGSVSQFKARADFSNDFFSVAGFESIYNDGTTNVNQAVENVIVSGKKIVVICSTDDYYTEVVVPFAKLLKSKKPEIIIVLAGYPTDKIEEYTAAGVDEYIHVKANIYQILSKMQKVVKE